MAKREFGSSGFSDESSSKSSDKLKIIITVILAVVVLVIGLGAYAINTGKIGGKIGENAHVAFGPVELPSNSKDLTRVPEAPVNQKDTGEDEYVGVDMEGRKINFTPHEKESTSKKNPTTRVTKDKSGKDVTVTEKPKDNGTKSKDNKDSNSNGDSPAGHTPQYEDREEYTKAINQVSNIGKRFEIPSVGLDVSLGKLNSHDGLIEPTNFTSAFVVTDYSKGWKDGSKGSTMVAFHALDAGGIAPGNFVVGVDNDEVRTNVGDEIKVGDRKFKISNQKRMGKGLVAYDKQVWANKPHTLVIVTCLPNSTDNFIIFADEVQ